MTPTPSRFLALVADDDPVSRATVTHLLEKWGYDVRQAEDGRSTWRAFGEEQVPQLVILDWEMPGLQGVDVCRRIRTTFGEQGIYVILLTSRAGKDYMVEGLEAGADDYLVKPFHVEELRARLRTGERILRMQAALSQRIGDLEETLASLRSMKGHFAVCSYCHQVRNEAKGWELLETYLARTTDAAFTHTVCPTCYRDHVDRDIEESSGSPPSR